MAEYDNSNRGSLFVNDRKEKESQPDYRGNVTVVSPSGESFEMWISGWKKKTRDGAAMLSISLRHKEEAQKPAAKAASKPAAKVADDLDDDIPF